MNTKNILVSFLLIASVLLLTATASAYTFTSAGRIADSATIKVESIDVETADVSVVAGDTVDVKVTFTATQNAPETKVRVELEGNEENVNAVTSFFDVEAGKTYVKTLTLKVPADFEDEELSNVLDLNVRIWNSDFETEVREIALNVQRVSYDVEVKSVIMSSKIEAGEATLIDVVLKNMGYNSLDDVYVTVSVPELGFQRSAYFGDMVNVTNEDDDDDDTINGRISLDIPYSVKAGTYVLEVKVDTDKSTHTAIGKITIENTISDVALISGKDLILLNPTSKLTAYTVKYLSNEEVVIVPAESSKAMKIESADGEFDITVYSGDNLLSTVKFSGETTGLTSSGLVLVIVLGVVFLVLLAVLVVLLTKKPQKAEEFGESYY
jgi:hypothetical protein